MTKFGAQREGKMGELTKRHLTYPSYWSLLLYLAVRGDGLGILRLLSPFHWLRRDVVFPKVIHVLRTLHLRFRGNPWEPCLKGESLQRENRKRNVGKRFTP
jgi:hypothetical protein